MPIILDHQLREHIPHNAREFPITYYHDELVILPDRTGPLHWHPEFEIATAEFGVLDYQVGEHHIILEAGDSIFVEKVFDCSAMCYIKLVNINTFMRNV